MYQGRVDMTIHDNLIQIRESMEKALERAGRKDTVTLVVVSKTQPPEVIEEAVNAGVRILGENRVQEALQKKETVDARTGGRAEWHMVGHLQRNKVRHAVRLFTMIQSIDKVETAAEISKRVEKPMDILIEVNSSGEETKSGVHPDGLFELADRIRELERVVIRGLMTIGPLTTDEKRVRDAFTLTRGLYDRLLLKHPDLDMPFLSMGMTSDFEAAIEEGSTMVRIGTAVFGTRRI